MKKYLMPLFIALIILCLSGCNISGQTSDENTSSNTSQDSQHTTQSKPEPTEETTPVVPDETTVTDESSQEITTTPTESEPVNPNGDPIIATVEALIGIPFVDGGATPEKGFDNSGLIYYVLRENGYINCPRSTTDQKVMGTNISIDEIKAGDLVFFSNDLENPDDTGFGGIYIGDGKLVYSPFPGENVKIADITTTYWTEHFLTAVSLS